MDESGVPTGITIAVGTEGGRARELAATLAAAFDVSVATVDVESASAEAGQTPAETLAAAIVADIPTDHLLVIESEHADRWRSRHSVAEHLVDAHHSTTLALGPVSSGVLRDGPIIVALDGSETARAGLVVAQQLAAAVDRQLLLARVVPEALHDVPSASVETITGDLEREASSIAGSTTSIVIESNDPVSALVELCAGQDASFITLASAGDRQTARPTMSRTAAGLIAEASCPVLVARSGVVSTHR